mmetsp:Transcript_30180/g.45397  ORF Transcript_30180/g.45397 Transcript_30180/m.45397 type:complete len:90 (-) Transcript_30180:970-1239(-)
MLYSFHTLNPEEVAAFFGLGLLLRIASVRAGTGGGISQTLLIKNGVFSCSCLETAKEVDDETVTVGQLTLLQANQTVGAKKKLIRTSTV